MKERLMNIIGKMVRQRTGAAVLMCCAALGWWGAVYPQFTLLSGTYRIVDETDGTALPNKAGADEIVQMDGAGISQMGQPNDILMGKGVLYWQILGADGTHIRIKSRLWEDWKALWGAEREHYDSGEE